MESTCTHQRVSAHELLDLRVLLEYLPAAGDVRLLGVLPRLVLQVRQLVAQLLHPVEQHARRAGRHRDAQAGASTGHVG